MLVRARFHPVLITGDQKQALLQVRIAEKDRDALRFLWFKDMQTKTIEVLIFTRALFGLAPSPFLLGGMIQQHLENFRTDCPEIVSEIEKSLYVDDLISGGKNENEAEHLKSKSTEIFADTTFSLHKWHSNVLKLESPSKVNGEDTWRRLRSNNLAFQMQGTGAFSVFRGIKKGYHWSKVSIGCS